jgi:anti-anti-sigma regulatory factor
MTEALVVRRIRGLTVAAFPAEVDETNAGGIRDQALRLLDDGAPALVLDLSATRFCACAGVSAVTRVGHRGAALATPVCLVLPVDGPVHRIALMTGLPERLLVRRTLAAALEALGHRA